METSFEKQISTISRAWDVQHNQPVMPGMAAPAYSWIIETHPDFVIVSVKDKYFQINYLETSGAITFDDPEKWVQVEEKKEWIDVAKSIIKSITSWIYQKEKVSPTNHLKTLSKTDDELRVGNYIVLFGGRDLEWLRSGKNADGSQGEFFTEKTNFESAYTKSGVLHVDWEHGLGKTLDGQDAPGPDDVLGYVDWSTAKYDEKGIWVERALTRRNQYMKFLEELIDAGLVGTSSEAISGGVKRAKTGEIKAWPLERDTLTFSPAEPRMMTENVVTALKSLAEVYPNLRSLLQDGETVDAADDAEDFSLLQLRAKALLTLME